MISLDETDTASEIAKALFRMLGRKKAVEVRVALQEISDKRYRRARRISNRDMQIGQSHMKSGLKVINPGKTGSAAR